MVTELVTFKMEQDFLELVDKTESLQAFRTGRNS